MALNHNLTIPEKTWQKLRHAASQRNLAVHELIETYLENETAEPEPLPPLHVRSPRFLVA
jgi:hypothetical protein